MKNIGLFGTNLSIAAHKVKNAKTPAEAKFRAGLLNDDQAREVVDKIDFVSRSMQELDDSKLDQDGSEGGVAVDAQAKKLGNVGRWMGALNSPLNAITTQAPKAEQAPEVKGYLKDDQMEVSVAHGESEATTFSKMRKDDGSTVYQVGDLGVTMQPDGGYLLSGF